jgi:hypothetical protein
MAKRIPPILIAFLLIAAAIACNFPSSDRSDTPSPEVDEIKETVMPQPTQEAPTSTGAMDCGYDFDCFIEKASTCSPASGVFIAPVDFIGVLITTTSFVEIKGLDEGKCVFYIRTEDVKMEYSDELIQQMLDGGLTEEEIEQQRQLAEEQAQQVGIDDTCRFNTSDLEALLRRWQQGNFSSEDYDMAECEGEMFGE